MVETTTDNFDSFSHVSITPAPLDRFWNIRQILTEIPTFSKQAWWGGAGGDDADKLHGDGGGAGGPAAGPRRQQGAARPGGHQDAAHHPELRVHHQAQTGDVA